jgi:hypothetical protein
MTIAGWIASITRFAGSDWSPENPGFRAAPHPQAGSVLRFTLGLIRVARIRGLAAEFKLIHYLPFARIPIPPLVCRSSTNG